MIADRREPSEVAIGGGGERSEMEGRDPRWRAAIRGGGERSALLARRAYLRVDRTAILALLHDEPSK